MKVAAFAKTRVRRGPAFWRTRLPCSRFSTAQHLERAALETDNLAFFEQTLRAAVEMCGCRQVVYTEQYDRVGAAGADPSAPSGEYPSETYAWAVGHHSGGRPYDRPLYWRVCRLVSEWGHPGFGSSRPNQDERVVTCADTGEVVARVVELLKRVDLDAFADACGGDGPFDCDSATRVGFRLHLSCMTRGLTVALCHVFYPK